MMIWLFLNVLDRESHAISVYFHCNVIFDGFMIYGSSSLP